MARIRSIKPELPQSESIGRLSRDARLLFILLWTLCDDHGRCRASHRVLAGALYPYDEDAPDLIGSWLDELATEGCIRVYRVNGSSYLEVTGWSKHQRIDNAGKPLYPAPTECDFVNNSENEVKKPQICPVREPPRTAANNRESRLDLGEGPRIIGSRIQPSADAVASVGEPPRIAANPRDLKTELFGACLEWLAQTSGRLPEKLRPMVGRWVRDHGEAPVLDAFLRAKRDGPVEPIAWIEGVLRGTGKRKSAIEEGLTGWLRENGVRDESAESNQRGEGSGEIVRHLPVPAAGAG